MNRPWFGGSAVIGGSTRISDRRVIMELREKPIGLGVLVFNLWLFCFRAVPAGYVPECPPDCARGVTDGEWAIGGRAKAGA